jgi:hypothetical protein
MDAAITTVSIAELADRAARLAIQTMEPQPNPFEPGTADHTEFAKRFDVAMVRHSAHPEGEGTA